MATIDYPTTPEFVPRAVRWGAATPKSAWSAFFTGQQQSVSHLADRLRIGITLPPCSADGGARREAFFGELASAGHWVRLGHWRLVPQGTLRGTPTVATSAAVGARTIALQGVAGATLLAGDVVGIGAVLHQVAIAGAVGDGAGVLTVPLVLPLRKAITAGAAVTWQAPTGTFQLALDQVAFDVGRGAWQGPLELAFVETI